MFCDEASPGAAFIGEDMSEIKFRLIEKGQIVGYERWNSIAGKWCYDTKSDGIFDIRNEFIPHTDKEQFTGLKDKNGKEIDWWEGDLLKSPEGEICIIEYNPYGAGFYLKNPKYKNGYWYPIYKVRKTWKKIGNIHETPDLLAERAKK